MTIKRFEIKRQELAQELETLFTEYRKLYPTVHPKVTDFLDDIEEQARETLSIDTCKSSITVDSTSSQLD